MGKAVILLKRLEFTAIYDAYRKVRLFFYNSGLHLTSGIPVNLIIRHYGNTALILHLLANGKDGLVTKVLANISSHLNFCNSIENSTCH